MNGPITNQTRAIEVWVNNPKGLEPFSLDNLHFKQSSVKHYDTVIAIRLWSKRTNRWYFQLDERHYSVTTSRIVRKIVAEIEWLPVDSYKLFFCNYDYEGDLIAPSE